MREHPKCVTKIRSGSKQNLEFMLKATDILSSIQRVSLDSERHNEKADPKESEYKAIEAKNLKHLDVCISL